MDIFKGGYVLSPAAVCRYEQHQSDIVYAIWQPRRFPYNSIGS